MNVVISNVTPTSPSCAFVSSRCQAYIMSNELIQPKHLNLSILHLSIFETSKPSVHFNNEKIRFRALKYDYTNKRYFIYARGQNEPIYEINK